MHETNQLPEIGRIEVQEINDGSRLGSQRKLLVSSLELQASIEEREIIRVLKILEVSERSLAQTRANRTHLALLETVFKRSRPASKQRGHRWDEVRVA